MNGDRLDIHLLLKEMTYTTEQAILDLITALGAQEISQIVDECNLQATDNPTEEKVGQVLEVLTQEGILQKQENLPCEIFPTPWTVWGYPEDF